MAESGVALFMPSVPSAYCPDRDYVLGPRACIVRDFPGRNKALARDGFLMAVESPCINICELDGKTGLCTGCLRTKDECKQWKKLKNKTRTKIIDERPKREAKLKKTKW
jgi:predicted Fe-S protein YdhL (DUF1289 family)